MNSMFQDKQKAKIHLDVNSIELININYSPMFKDPNDPTKCLLFSRCARNQASKTKAARPHTAHTRRSTPHTSQQCLRKKIVSQSWFEKQQSRQQREKKFKHDPTPSVGQYNPTLRPKVKMVWDILKVYHSHNKQKANVEAIRNTKKEPSPPKTTNSIVQAQKGQKSKKIIGDQFITEEIHHQPGNRQKTQASLSKSQCIVNMSRMTGRKLDQSRDEFSIVQHDISNSINYIKGKIVKNVLFDKQILRQQNKRATLNPGNTYSCNYDVIRPKKKGIVGFGLLKGREDKTDPLQKQYSYAHYEYDSYVWQSNSNIFPNTKTHVIDFRKQSSRYKELLPD